MIKDKVWRLNNLYKIKNKKYNLVYFQQNKIQRILNDPAKRKIILKARQFGISTNEIISCYDDAIWNDNYVSCILAHENDGIKKLFEIVRRAHESLNESIRPDLDRGGGSKYEFKFPKNGSKIYCDLESRGDTINRLHISEIAFIKEPERVIATMEAVPLDGIITWESTPNGIGNMFYEKWQDPGPFKKFFFPWYIFDEYKMKPPKDMILTEEELSLKDYAKKFFNVDLSNDQIEFRRFKKHDAKHLFVQEYPEDSETCFLSSGDSVFNLIKIKSLLDNCKKPIKEIDGIKIWKERDSKKNYVIGCDTSEGVKKDSSVSHVYSHQDRELVATFRSNNIKPSDFAHKINELANIYTIKTGLKPLVGVERNNHGHAVLLELDEHIRYPNIYVHVDDKKGWLTDRVTRPLMLDTFIDGLENNNIIINDTITLMECMTFINDNGRQEAAPNKNDDCIMASSLALQLILRSKNISLYSDIKNKILI